MADQPNVINQLINPLYVQTYERYIPTAFDEGMTLLEKMNKIILSLNRMGKLSNDVLDQWNQVMDWTMADGLDSAIDSKIDSMLADGSLASIIGTAISDLDTRIDGMNQTITDFETTVNNNNTNAQNALNATLANIQYYGTPEQFGAKGDGVTDDTQAIQDCLNASKVTVFQPKTYVISKTLILPENNSIDGQHAELKVTTAWVNVNNGTSVPQGSMLWVKGRQPVAGTEIAMSTRFIKNIKLTGNTSITNLEGIFAGTSVQGNVTDSSCVNYAVYETQFSNITTNYVYNGIHLAEVWACHFEKMNTPNSGNAGLLIQGQIVNNTFTACQFSGLNYGVYVDGGNYVNGTTLRRPEGNVFLGGFIGSAKWGINFIRGLAFKFSSVIIDLNTINALSGTDLSDVTFDSCWMHSDKRVIDIQGMSTTVNGTFLSFNKCSLDTVAGGDPYTVNVGIRQNGVIFDGCKLSGVMYWDDASSGVIKNCFWTDTTTASPMIVKHATGILKMSDNTFKYDGTDIVTGTA